VAVHRSHEREGHFFRWFWDRTLNKDRIDGIQQFKDEFYFAEIVFDHAGGKEYRVYYQPGAINCFEHPINGSLPKPTFAQFNYIGKAIVNYQPAYHWIYEDKLRGRIFALYDRQDNREILRIDIDDTVRRRSESWVFFEYQVGAQNKEIFEINPLILAQCNPF